MKNKLLIFVSVLMMSILITSCGSTADVPEEPEMTKIVVGATSVPQAEILKVTEPILAEQDIELEIVEFADYTLMNQALVNGDLDANFFQHQPYLDSYVEQTGNALVSIGEIEIEPMAGYSNTIADIEDLPEGAKISIPNDPTNEARALLLLEANGIIKLDPSAGTNATPNDVIDNPKNVEFIEMDADKLARTINDVDLAIINTNNALVAGLDPATEAVIIEDNASEYANLLVVRAEDAEDPELLALVNALQSPEVEKYINETYNGAVIPAF